MKEGREEGGREGGKRRERGKGREGRNSSNERDVADLDLEVYKLISFFERRKEKKISKGEEERGRVNGNIALF